MSINADSHKLTPTAKIDLYSVDLNSIGVGEVHYFYAGTSTMSAPVVYLGDTYTPWLVKVSGIDKRGGGSSPRPTIEVGNANRLITDLCATYQDMVGATVRRRRTLAKYLLANTADFIDELYLIERRAEETNESVKFELASPMDFLNKQLPGVLALATGCNHRYRHTDSGSGCSWAGTNSAKWFSAVGDPVLTNTADVCGKRLSDCKLRFGATNPLDYAGNPGLGRSS
ncbi:phage minor tail protein L [Methylobacter sp. S3L5C]|uniref:phage minor tail protein L n=1 Tax=Methylobacter sp. S3L5C TaxID=2839024 RepID=UPI001FAC740E|nr:phage minor tail protein L [Methylobacter sp. S3L5C]UOA08321.1 phage minor tail protein L [Methylobacter sp. S3L5C]